MAFHFSKRDESPSLVIFLFLFQSWCQSDKEIEQLEQIFCLDFWNGYNGFVKACDVVANSALNHKISLFSRRALHPLEPFEELP